MIAADKPPELRFFRSCVQWSIEDCDDLNEIIEHNREISRSTFLRHVNREELKDIEGHLGYVPNKRQGLTMKNDWHVTYHRSKVYGTTVYYCRHSAIEWVFTPNGDRPSCESDT